MTRMTTRQCTSKCSPTACEPRTPRWQGRPLRGVIFDLDGVLVRTDEHHFRSWSMAAAELGLTVDRVLYDDHLRGLARRTAAELLLARLGHPVDDGRNGSLAARKNQIFQSLIAESPPPVADGAGALLVALRRLDVVIAVGSSSRNARQLLALGGLDCLIDAVVDGNDAPGKPNPRVFLQAAEQLQIPPTGCLVIEDTDIGVEAAQRAEMAVIVVGTGGCSIGTTQFPDLHKLHAALIGNNGRIAGD